MRLIRRVLHVYSMKIEMEVLMLSFIMCQMMYLLVNFIVLMNTHITVQVTDDTAQSAITLQAHLIRSYAWDKAAIFVIVQKLRHVAFVIHAYRALKLCTSIIFGPKTADVDKEARLPLVWGWR